MHVIFACLTQASSSDNNIKVAFTGNFLASDSASEDKVASWLRTLKQSDLNGVEYSLL